MLQRRIFIPVLLAIVLAMAPAGPVLAQPACAEGAFPMARLELYERGEPYREAAP